MINDSNMKTANRHIYRPVYEIRERVHQDKIVHPIKVSTKDNVSNALTKQESGLRDSARQLRSIAGPSTLVSPA